MDEKVIDCLNDILDSISEIKFFTEEFSFADYENDSKTQSATERKFEIIGECLNRISRIDEELLQKISNCREIISFRNILAHGYDSVDNLTCGELFNRIFRLCAK